MLLKKLFIAVIITAGCSLNAFTQVYPYLENFEGFNQFGQITGNGYLSDMNAYPRGINNTQCAQAQVFNLNKLDTLVTPVVGPLTANSQLSFYFRVVSYIASTAVGYTLPGGAGIDVLAGNQQAGIYQSVYSITSANQNSGTTFLKVNVSLGAGAGQNVNIKFKVNYPSGSDTWVFHLDSLAVNDGGGTPALAVNGTSENVSCNGGNDGSIDITATGGTPAYTYAWSNSATSEDLSNVVAGTYTVTVTDGGGQTASRSFTITEPSSVTAAASSTDASCANSADGTATVIAAGGAGNYDYDWSDGSTTSSISDLAADTYYVTVADDNGCTATDSVTVDEPAALTGSTSSTPSSGANGTATVTANGGTPPYSYVWNTSPAQDSSTATALASGNYSVTVTDDNECTNVETVFVEAIIGISNNLQQELSVYPNPAENMLFIQAPGKVSAAIFDAAGKQILALDGVTGNVPVDISDLKNGMYSVRIISGSDSKSVTFIKR